MDLGTFILENRLKKKWTRGQLAYKAGCTERAIDYWEKGKRNIRADYLDKILKALGVKLVLGKDGEI